ncbi:MAG: alpha/beta hydrolase [Acidobacteria bacterium]|nr:alpha/beta hydrolase [Acidobacteriota bacterium]
MLKHLFQSTVWVIAMANAMMGQQALPPLPAPMAIPKPALPTDKPYAAQAILQGGIVMPLYPEGSPFVNADKVKIPEVYNMSQAVPGRISSIVSIHNPSIEIHTVERGINTGAVIILAAGGGHRTLNVGGESADFVSYFYNFGINTVILRNRLRSDGYEPRTDAVNDALQAIRMVRAYAKEFSFDPNKIGILGFSAGAELSAPAAVQFAEFDAKNASGPFGGISSRPDFVGMIYPGPSPFAQGRVAPGIPANVPPAFLACPGSGDRVHAIWAMEYYNAMLMKGVPNIEMHLYGNGVHGGALTDRKGIPMGTWQLRFMDWFRDLGFLAKSGVPTKAALDVEEFIKNPPKIPGSAR